MEANGYKILCQNERKEKLDDNGEKQEESDEEERQVGLGWGEGNEEGCVLCCF